MVLYFVPYTQEWMQQGPSLTLRNVLSRGGEKHLNKYSWHMQNQNYRIKTEGGMSHLVQEGEKKK